MVTTFQLSALKRRNLMLCGVQCMNLKGVARSVLVDQLGGVVVAAKNPSEIKNLGTRRSDGNEINGSSRSKRGCIRCSFCFHLLTF